MAKNDSPLVLKANRLLIAYAILVLFIAFLSAVFLANLFLGLIALLVGSLFYIPINLLVLLIESNEANNQQS